MAVKILKFPLGMVRANCYIVYNDITNEALVIDPADNGAYINTKLKENNLTLKAVLLTHGHFDHIMAVQYLKNTFNVRVYAHESEEEILADASKNLSASMGGAPLSINADILLEDNQKLELIGTTITVIHTPGHTAGGVCYYFESEKLLFSGDTLFRDSVGRTDFPTGSMSVLVRSIKEKLITLGDDVVVYPGHEGETTISRERKFNPFIG